jgi:hypothetical protein
MEAESQLNLIFLLTEFSKWTSMTSVIRKNNYRKEFLPTNNICYYSTKQKREKQTVVVQVWSVPHRLMYWALGADGLLEREQILRALT